MCVSLRRQCRVSTRYRAADQNVVPRKLPCLFPDLLPAIAGGVDRYLGAGEGAVELALHVRHLHGLAAAGQALVEAVEAPDVLRVLASAGQFAVEPEICTIDR